MPLRLSPRPVRALLLTLVVLLLELNADIQARGGRVLLYTTVLVIAVALGFRDLASTPAMDAGGFATTWTSVD